MNVTHRGVFLQMYCVRDLLCADINECLDERVCAHGQCSNLEGYFICTCDEGFSLTPDGKACTGTIRSVEQLLVFFKEFVHLYLV